jgi:hypothetical protein
MMVMILLRPAAPHLSPDHDPYIAFLSVTCTTSLGPSAGAVGTTQPANTTSDIVQSLESSSIFQLPPFLHHSSRKLMQKESVAIHIKA